MECLVESPSLLCQNKRRCVYSAVCECGRKRQSLKDLVGMFVATLTLLRLQTSSPLLESTWNERNLALELAF